MASPEFYTNIETARATLVDTNTDFIDYMQKLASQKGSIIQDGEMTETERELRQKLTEIRSANETFNREYQDRAASGATRISRPGLQTTQDLVLAWFFGSYLLLTILIMIYLLRYTENKSRNVISLLVISIVFGLITAYVLLQLA